MNPYLAVSMTCMYVALGALYLSQDGPLSTITGVLWLVGGAFWLGASWYSRRNL